MRPAWTNLFPRGILSFEISTDKGISPMRRYAVFPILALGGGCAAFVLRLLQWRTGFEPDTGLPIPGTPFGAATAVLAAAVLAICFLLRKKLPEEAEGAPVFPAGFSVTEPAILTLAVTGVFLMAAAGLADIAAGMGIQGLPGAELSSAAASREHLILGVLTLAAAVCLFPAIPACRAGSRETPRPFNGVLMLAPVVCLVVRLVLVYRQDSANPVLAAYWVELLALVFVILALYRLAAFAYGAGRTRRFVLYAVPAIALCLAALADGGLSNLLFNGGAALTLTGFLLQRLTSLSRPWDEYAA